LHLRRLLGRRRARLDHGQFVIEGTTLVAEALDSRWPLEAVYVDGGATLGDTESAVLDRARAAGVPVRVLADGVLARVADTVTPQPLVAVATRPAAGLGGLGEVLAPPPPGVTPGPVLVLAGVADPGNAGTLIRSAEASGARAVVFAGATVDPFGPKTVRASAGTVLQVPIIESPDALAALHALGRAGVRRLATTAHEGTAYDRVALAGPVAFVLGSEAHGLPAGLDPEIDEWVTIPMVGRAESLNVAVAGSLLCFEHLRRRNDWTTQQPDDRVSG